MDKPWGEMQKGSESKQVVPLDRDLKKVSTRGLYVVLHFTMTILTIFHTLPDTTTVYSPLQSETKEREEEEECQVQGKSNVFVGLLVSCMSCTAR